jgi:hypothetical protein
MKQSTFRRRLRDANPLSKAMSGKIQVRRGGAVRLMNTIQSSHAPGDREWTQGDEQQYLYMIESRAFNIIARFESEVGRTLIRNGAANLDSNPGNFDKNGRLTASGVDAIIEGGMTALWRQWREATQPLPTLTRSDINAIREWLRIAPV